MIVVPESVRAKGSSKSGGLLYIFTCSHLHYPHMFTYSHHLIFTSSHRLTFTYSYFHIFTCSHLHIFTSSHLHIFAHFLFLSLSRPSPSHLDIFLPSHTHIFKSSHLLSSSIIFSSSHLLIFTSSLSLSCPLSRSLSFFFCSPLRPQAVPTRRHDMATLSHEVRVSKTESVFASSALPRQPCRTK